MKPKVLVTVILLVFIAAAITYVVVEETRTNGRQASSQTSSQAPAERAERDSRMVETNGKAQPEAGDASVKTPGEPSASAKTAPRPAATATDARKPVRDDKASTPAAATPGTEATARPGEARSPEAASKPRVIAYYFHATQRCATCRKLEAYSHEAITQRFAAQLEDGSLEWRAVNTDEPENKHFLDDYKLYTRSLVIVKMQQGRQVDWKNLEKIWDLVDDKPGFLEYVQREIGAYMGTS